MNRTRASDEVIDMIAHIEMHRQEMAKESDAAAAGAEALRKLHELLEHERASMQTHAAGTTHSVNIETVSNEIRRIQQLSGVSAARPAAFKPNPRQQPVARPNPPHNPDRSNVRRTMGRRGER